MNKSHHHLPLFPWFYIETQELKNRFSVPLTEIVSNKKCSFVRQSGLAGFLSLIKVSKQTRCQYDGLSLL